MSISNRNILCFIYNTIGKTHMSRQYHQFAITNKNVQRKKISLFEKEVKRQAALFPDVEKIEVKYEDKPEECTLMMNKNMSTPFNCAQHINLTVMERSVLAEVNGQLWDMHRPLEEDCTLKFLHFKQPDPHYVNKAFWRSASLMLGAVLESAFKDEFYVELCSFPSPNVRSGSFLYDVDLKMDTWNPSKEELRSLSSEMVKLSLAKHNFQRLEVDAKLALEIFANNRYKKAQVPHIAAQSPTGNSVTLYRVGDFIDMSRGPMISNTSQFGKVTIGAVHRLDTDGCTLHRVQGVALPKGFMLNHFTYGIIEERSKQLNPGRVPVIAAFERPLMEPTTEYSMQE